MAPEMFGSGHRNAAVDIYSLGYLYIAGESDGMQIMQRCVGHFILHLKCHLDIDYVKHATIQQVIRRKF